MENTNTASELPDSYSPTVTDTVIRLGHAFLRFAQRDGEKSSEDLSIHMGVLQSNLSRILELQQSSQGNGEEIPALVNEALNAYSQIIVSMQFFDRISQRMDHALKCFQILESTDVQSPLDSSFNLYSIHQVLTMEDERDVFNHILAGAPVGKALDIATQAEQERQAGDDSIELF
ncbi:MAG: hypothetical protein OEX00_00995 [Gammaproteobacteria bacterium]|nr:hypothetical protein [Gammaproteobacteria bacterium]MDH5694304.1 hypothetical protein [Gammaproteobacteria bacterium]